MPTLSREAIAALVHPYLQTDNTETDYALPVCDSEGLYAKLSDYLDLLLRWNARTNLTAIGDPEEIVRRHFGESLFTGVHLSRLLKPGDEVLDFGSGAGFPGLPIQILLPELRVTLAESQGKKAAFLREAVRLLRASAEVWGERVEALPVGRRFACVTLRAVDNPTTAQEVARARLAPGGYLVELSSGTTTPRAVAMPGLHRGYLRITREEE